MSNPLLLLDLTDADYKWVEQKFRLAPPGFRYAQRTSGSRLSRGEELLVVELESVSATRATAKGTFATDSSFAVYKYLLVLGTRGWEVASSELFLAS